MNLFVSDLRSVLEGIKVRLFCEEPLPGDTDGAVALQIALRERRGVAYHIQSLVDGEMHDIHVRLHPLRGESGVFSHYVCSPTDIQTTTYPQRQPPAEASGLLIELRFTNRHLAACYVITPAQLGS